MVSKDPHMLFLFIKAYLPMMVLFSLIAFIYITYLNTYLIQLLTNEYNYDTNQQSSANPTFFIMVHQMSHQTNNFVEFFLGFTTLGYSTTQKKGIAYAVVLHFYILMFMISTFRVIKTNPGSVPEDWNNETEKELCDLVETEKKILRNIRRQVRKRKNQEEEEKNHLESSKSEIKLVSSDDQQIGPTSQVLQNIESDQQTLVIDDEERPSRYQGQGGPHDRMSESQKIEGTQEDLDSELDSEEEEEERQNSDKVHQLAVMSALKRGNKRYCGHCQKFKPERAHHCRQCGTCVLKMDHHCPWVSNCVGFYNYKYFMNMVLYGNLLLTMVVVTYSELVKDAIFNTSFSSFELYVILLNYILNWLLALVITVFFFFHIWLIMIGKSTLEFCEKKRDTKYSFGKYENLKRVFGKNVFLWMIPFSPYTQGGGVIYK